MLCGRLGGHDGRRSSVCVAVQVEQGYIRALPSVDCGRVNTGDPKEAIDFFLWGIERAPSDHVAIIFSGLGISPEYVREHLVVDAGRSGAEESDARALQQLLQSSEETETAQQKVVSFGRSLGEDILQDRADRLLDEHGEATRRQPPGAFVHPVSGVHHTNLFTRPQTRDFLRRHLLEQPHR